MTPLDSDPVNRAFGKWPFTLHKKCPYSEFSNPYFPIFGVNRRFTLQISVFSANAGKYGPENFRIRTLFMQRSLDEIDRKKIYWL